MLFFKLLLLLVSFHAPSQVRRLPADDPRPVYEAPSACGCRTVSGKHVCVGC